MGSDAGQTYLKITEKVEENLEAQLDVEEDNLQEDRFELPNECSSRSKELITVEYHVVYSVSYQVPMLFFRGYRSSEYFY